MSATRDSGYNEMIHGLTLYPGKGDYLMYKFIIDPSMVTKWTNNRFEAEQVPGLVSVAPFPKDSNDWDDSFVAVPCLFTLKAKGVLKANERPNDFMLFMQQQKFEVTRNGSDETIKCTLSSHYMAPVPKKKAKVVDDTKIDMNNDPFIGFLLARAGFGSLDEAKECYGAQIQSS
jgi:hypothetical protein